MTGSPILLSAPTAIESKVAEMIEKGDHHIVVGEVVEDRLSRPPEGRVNAAVLEIKDLGDNVFYGG